MVRCFLQFSKLFGKLLESHPIFLSRLQVLTPVPYVTYHCRSCMAYAEVKITSKSTLCSEFWDCTSFLSELLLSQTDNRGDMENTGAREKTVIPCLCV